MNNITIKPATFVLLLATKAWTGLRRGKHAT